MAEKVTGYVRRITSKTGESARGPWTAYSFKIIGADGVEDPRWYQFGFEAPAFKADNFNPETKTYDHSGDYISFEADINGNVGKFVKGSGKIEKNGPARAADAPRSGGGGKKPWGGGGGAPAKEKDSDMFGKIGGYNTEDDIKRMSLTASRSAAIETVKMLLENDALPLTKTKGKANEAVRFEEVTKAIDKLTVAYFHDTRTGRLLDTVEDRPEGKMPAPLPDDTAAVSVEDDEDEAEVVEDYQDDIPF